MSNDTLRIFCFFCAATSLTTIGILAGCSSDGSPSAPAGPTDPTTPPTTMPLPTDGGVNPVPPTDPNVSVTLSYKPSWKGAKTVEVLGAFGQATDWKMPFATLVVGTDGTFTATMMVTAGTHPYLFKVTGDEASSMPAKLVHYAVDPKQSAFAACPADAPTYNDDKANPCSILTAPSTASTIGKVTGIVRAAGAPIADYLVMIERDEPSSHHMFADRTTTKADGKFELDVALGTYRVQVLHPTFYSKTDADRNDPETLAAVRRTMSSAITVTGDVMLSGAEVGYPGYAAMSPRGNATLPTTFTYSVLDGATARVVVYGPAKTIGDPWWSSKAGEPTFDGDFDTAAAKDAGILADASYFWGTEQTYPKKDGGVTWTAQSMVYPVAWP